MTRKRQILNCLTKSYLIEIAKDYEISGAYRMNLGDLVDALSRKRSVEIEEILNELSLQDLKIICQNIGVDDKGNKKAILIDRLLGHDEKQVKPKKVVEPKPVKKPEPKPKPDKDRQDTKTTIIITKPKTAGDLKSTQTDAFALNNGIDCNPKDSMQK